MTHPHAPHDAGLVLPHLMHYQPIVDLDDGGTVAYEALARDSSAGTPGPPARMFARARALGRLPELDWACRTAALVQAGQAGLDGLALFVNTEPAAAGTTAPDGYLTAERSAPPGLVRVLEVTERALAERPGPLLALVDRARRHGWRIALDDLGAQWASLSLLPFLAPDVVKLDLTLVQQRTTLRVAEVVNAVAVQSARTGAVVLAEGIETPAQAELARSMGARLGQGYLLGRPAALPDRPPARAFPWPALQRPRAAGTPWQQLPPGAPVRRSTKPLLVGIARWLERQAVTIGDSAVLLATFERAEHFTPRAARAYASLAGGASIVGVYSQGMSAEPAPGVRGVALTGDDPLCDEWDVVVVGPHFQGALLAHDLGDTGPDDERRFDYVVTYDRDQVLAAAADLLARLPDLPARSSGRPQVDAGPAHDLRPADDSPGGDGAHGAPAGAWGDVGGGPPGAPVSLPHVRGAALPRLDVDLPPLLARALAASSQGLAIADADAVDLPLVYVNPAYERLVGLPAHRVLGRPALGPAATGDATDAAELDADSDAVDTLRRALRGGDEARATLRRTRPDGVRWWDETAFVPVRDQHDRLTHWVVTSDDVTERIDSAQTIAHLAHHDALTGLGNRRRLVEHLPAELARAARHGGSVAVLYLDVDAFKRVNDEHGHAAGDRVLVEVAARLGRHVRGSDLLVRHGGDEFLLVLSGLPGDVTTARAAAHAVADKLQDEVHRPLLLGDGQEPLRLSVSVGVSLSPHDTGDAAWLLEHADRALYRDKAARRAAVPGARPDGVRVDRPG